MEFSLEVMVWVVVSLVVILTLSWLFLSCEVLRTVMCVSYGIRFGVRKDDRVIWFLYFYWRDKDDINRRHGAKSRLSMV